MLNGLTFIASLGSVWLFMAGLSEAIELNEQKDRTRREEMRRAVYAVKRREWLIKQNRRKLWAEVTGYEDYLNG